MSKKRDKQRTAEVAQPEAVPAETSQLAKTLFWLADEKAFTVGFSPRAAVEATDLFDRICAGENVGMPQSRPMPSIGPRCHELRIRDAAANWRIFYLIDVEAIVILGIHLKKTQATPDQTIDLMKKRIRDAGL